MPYAADFTPTYKTPIRTYWINQINATAYSNKAAMITQLDTVLNNVSTAEINYKNLQNNLSENRLRTRWRKHFGFFTLYVLYKHCMVFPANANLPSVPDMMIPWPSGALGVNDDLRGFTVGYRHYWPGNGTTSTPWFTLSNLGGGLGRVDEINHGIGVGEATAIRNSFNNQRPLYNLRVANSASYLIGSDSGGGNYTSISDINPAGTDYERVIWDANPNQGVIDRLKEFINYHNWTTENRKRFRDGQTILNYLTAGREVTMINKPKEWMLSHGGQELMSYMEWTDITGNML